MRLLDIVPLMYSLYSSVCFIIALCQYAIFVKPKQADLHATTVLSQFASQYRVVYLGARCSDLTLDCYIRIRKEYAVFALKTNHSCAVKRSSKAHLASSLL